MDNKSQKKDFEFLEKTQSDICFKAYGRDLEELFVNSAKALFSIICKIDMVPKKREFKVSLIETPEELLYDWLTKLLVIYDSEEVFLSDFKVDISPLKGADNKYQLNARCFGDKANSKLSLTQVKAITRYMFELKQTKEGYEAQVVVDV
jgi:SHS2 domain-containing protein